MIRSTWELFHFVKLDIKAMFSDNIVIDWEWDGTDSRIGDSYNMSTDSTQDYMSEI